MSNQLFLTFLAVVLMSSCASQSSTIEPKVSMIQQSESNSFRIIIKGASDEKIATELAQAEAQKKAKEMGDSSFELSEPKRGTVLEPVNKESTSPGNLYYDTIQSNGNNRGMTNGTIPRRAAVERFEVFIFDFKLVK